MGIISDAFAEDSRWFADPDVGFGETISYTPYVNGVAQTTVSITAVIDRNPPELMQEGPVRVKTLRLSIPVSSVAGVGLATRPMRGDKLVASWQIGETATTFRVTANNTRDAGMWDITAEEAKG